MLYGIWTICQWLKLKKYVGSKVENSKYKLHPQMLQQFVNSIEGFAAGFFL
jgi:hypothetical protein